MIYRVCFPGGSIEKRFHRALSQIPQVNLQERIMEEVEKLSENPYPYGKKSFRTIDPPVKFYRSTARYRLRVGDYRILYDVDDKKRIVWIFALRRRGRKTYK